MASVKILGECDEALAPHPTVTFIKSTPNKRALTTHFWVKKNRDGVLSTENTRLPSPRNAFARLSLCLNERGFGGEPETSWRIFLS